MKNIDYSKASNRMKAAREKMGYSFEELAKLVGMSKSTLQRYETGGIKKMPIDNVVPLAKALNVTAEYLLGDFSSDNLPDNLLPVPKMNRIPLLGTIACGVPLLAQENVEGMVDVPEHVHADFTLRCKGDSMINARIFDGDIVYIRQQPDVEDGEIAAVLIEDEATLKRVYKIGGIRLELRAENPTFPVLKYEGAGLADVKIIGKAVYFLSAVR